MFGPSLAAIILTYHKSGGRAVKPLFAGLLRWRVPAFWYCVVVLSPMAVSIISITLYGLLTGSWLEFRPSLPAELRQAGLLAYVILSIFWILESLGEEIGWRGYALPRLVARHSPLVASLILGVVWALWHIPRFLTEGSAQSQIPFSWYFLYTFSLAILFTWLYMRTSGNLWLATLLHAANQPATVLLPILPTIVSTILPYLISVIVTTVLARIVVIFSFWTTINFPAAKQTASSE